VVVVAVAAMQLIGPRRYGPFTFCLTLVALALNSAGQAILVPRHQVAALASAGRPRRPVAAPTSEPARVAGATTLASNGQDHPLSASPVSVGHSTLPESRGLHPHHAATRNWLHGQIKGAPSRAI
jgi:hypothetical protein